MAYRRRNGELTHDQLVYLAGMIESQLYGLKNPNSDNPVGISKREDWPKAMAETYGGVADFYNSPKKNRRWFGWYVSCERRYELFMMAQKGGYLKNTHPYELGTLQMTLERAMNRETESGGWSRE